MNIKQWLYDDSENTEYASCSVDSSDRVVWVGLNIHADDTTACLDFSICNENQLMQRREALLRLRRMIEAIEDEIQRLASSKEWHND